METAQCRCLFLIHIFDPSGPAHGMPLTYFWQVCVCFLRNELTSQGLPNSLPELCCDWERAGSHSGGSRGQSEADAGSPACRGSEVPFGAEVPWGAASCNGW